MSRPIDPNALPNATGRKDDEGKTDWSLLSLRPLAQVVHVLMYGARKYGRENYKLVPNFADRYYSAAMRHLADWQEQRKRENTPIDGDTGKSPLAHAICDLLFLLERELEVLKQDELIEPSRPLPDPPTFCTTPNLEEVHPTEQFPPFSIVKICPHCKQKHLT